MFRFVFLYFLSILFTITETDAQIVAGDTTNSHHVSFNPYDSVDFQYRHPIPTSDSLLIDADGDGVNDFRFFGFGGGGLGGGEIVLIFNGLDSSRSVVAHIDSFPGCCPANYAAIFPDTIESGELIDENRNFKSYATIYEQTFGGLYGPYVSEWMSIGDHFIGFRIQYPFDTLFGWVRLEVTSGPYGVVKEFACNKNTHIGFEDRTIDLPLIYPNPFNTRLILKKETSKTTEFRICDQTGRLIYSALFSNRCINWKKRIVTRNRTA
mgnify:CR=1 FL=1